MFLRYVLEPLALLICVSKAFPWPEQIGSTNQSLALRAYGDEYGTQLRTVDLRMKLSYKNRATDSNGRITFAWHTSLEISGTKDDPSLKIQVVEDKITKDYIFLVDSGASDKQNENPNPRDELDAGVKRLYQGTTKFTNYAIYQDKENGKTISAVHDDPIYRTGKANIGHYNTCHDFVTRVMGHMNLELSEEAKSYMDNYESTPVKKDVTEPVKRIEAWNTVSTKDKKGNTGSTRSRDSANTYDVETTGCAKRNAACFKITPVKGDAPNYNNYQNELATLQDQTEMTPDDLAVTSDGELAPDAKVLPPESVAGPEGPTVSLAKAGGVLKTFTMVGKDVLAGVGAAAAVVGAVFVILDFIGHDWVGGAIGGVGLIAGIAVTFAVEGPVGWVVGGLVAALFAILPGLFKKPIDPADRTDIQGIIQFKFFGDPKHTGNEQCRKGTKDAPGNPDCQALYGAGAVSAGLDMNNFDSIAFLVQFNEGYPMTIPDMAKNFYVVDENKKGDGDDKMAVIKCHNTASHFMPIAGEVGGDKPAWCNKPEFVINRKMVNFQQIGDTADHVYNRIIGPGVTNGDCKLIAHPGSEYIKSYNVTLTGLPVAIACGLNNVAGIDGKEVPRDSTSRQGTDGSASTDGQGAAYVPAPPATPFKPLAQKDYACIYHGSNQPFCLPPGTYHKQSGLGFEVKDIDTLTLPSGGGWSLATHWATTPRRMLHRRIRIQGAPPSKSQPPSSGDNTYNVNQTPSIQSDQWKTFVSDWQHIDEEIDGKSTFHVTAPNDGPDPVCCLFTEASFGGNVWCMGVGGGDVLPQWKNKAQSVSCHNGAQVWLYADHYNDEGGALIRGNVEDLKDEPYGTGKASFSKNVKALWVSAGS